LAKRLTRARRLDLPEHLAAFDVLSDLHIDGGSVPEDVKPRSSCFADCSAPMADMVDSTTPQVTGAVRTVPVEVVPVAETIAYAPTAAAASSASRRPRR
jgi:hypothetical protein